MESGGISVDEKHAQEVHSLLLKHGLIDGNRRVKHSKGVVVFPVKKISAEELAEIKKIPSAKKTAAVFEPRKTSPGSLKEALSKKLSKKEMTFAPTAFDSLGNAAIIEIPKELKGKEKLIGESLLETRNSIESVFMKAGAHKGVFREEPVKLIAGKKTSRALYREHGCKFLISLGKVFFSPRLATERKRISKLIKKGEEVAGLFAGVGPFPIVFAKNSAMKRAVAIELNPKAVEDMRENILLNHVEAKVEPVLGDVKKLARKYEGMFDRAVMPLPKGGEDFLEDAIRYIKDSGGTVHYYQFVSRENPFEVPLGQIKEACAATGRKHRILLKRKVRDFAPNIVQVVIDFRVWRG